MGPPKVVPRIFDSKFVEHQGWVTITAGREVTMLLNIISLHVINLNFYRQRFQIPKLLFLMVHKYHHAIAGFLRIDEGFLVWTNKEMMSLSKFFSAINELLFHIQNSCNCFLGISESNTGILLSITLQHNYMLTCIYIPT